MDAVAVGLGARDELLDELLALSDRSALDVLEVLIDDGLVDGPRRAAWRRLGARWPLVAHGTELGIADAAGVDPAYVARVGHALEALAARWYSEHLAFLRADGIALGHFAPASGSDALAGVLREAAAVVAAAARRPLLLENPADVLGWGREAGGEALGRGFASLVAAADAGVLLDLTNLVLGARNDGWEAAAWLHAIDLERVVEIHLAGGRLAEGLWIDSHDAAIDDEALELLRWVAPRAPGLRAVIVERDDHIPPLAAMLDEIERVRVVLARAGRS